MVVGEILERLPWVVSLAAFTSLLVAIVACICRGRKKETLEFGMAGLSCSSQNCAILVSQTLEKEKRLSSNYGSSEQIADLRTRPSSVNRALPDIPISSVPHQSSFSDTDTDLELYAAVTKPSEVKSPGKLKNHRPNKPRAPQPPRPHQNSDFSDVQASTSNKYQVIGNTQVSPRVSNRNGSVLPGERGGHRPIPNHYDQPSGSGETSTDMKDSDIIPVHVKGSNKLFVSTSSLCSSDADTYEPPPVPEKRFDRTEDDNRTAESDWRPSSLLVGVELAQAADVSADRSHVMPANIHVTQAVDAARELDAREGHEVPYTVISVREPLAKVREQTFQQMKRRLPHQQSSSSQEGESHYMEVADEEQTYAEIDSSHNSGRGSSMYDRIEPPSERDLPPAPPTVESLMTVAHVHSRQASSASAATSHSSRSSSPRAVSPTSASQAKDVNGLYSVVNKPNKQRQTIHVAEGASLLPFHTEPSTSTVEDLYAKVRKNRSSASTSGTSFADVAPRSSRDMDDVFYPPSCSTDTPPEPPPIAGRIRATSLYDPATRSVTKHTDHRLSISPDGQHQEPPQKWAEDEPGYERVKQDHSYEKVACDSDDPGYEIIQGRQLPNVVVDSGYEQIRNSCVKEYEASDPGYERVHEMARIENDLCDPGYESVSGVIREDSDMDPDYEQISRICQNSESDNDVADPGYECVHINGQDDSGDPGYDHVVLERRDGDSDFGDSDYETVSRITRCDSEGYERIKGIRRTESDATEPGYERVRVPLQSSSAEGNFADKVEDNESLDPGYEPVGPSSPLTLSRQVDTTGVVLNTPFDVENSSEHISQMLHQNSDGRSYFKFSDSVSGVSNLVNNNLSEEIIAEQDGSVDLVNGHKENSVISNEDSEENEATSHINVGASKVKGTDETKDPEVKQTEVVQDYAQSAALMFRLQPEFVRDIEDTSL